MKRIFVISIILLSFTGTSCITLKKCTEKFQWHSDTLKTIVYRDTIIPVYIPKTDTVYKYGAIHDTVRINLGNAHTITFIRHDTIESFLWLSDTTLKVKLDSAIKITTILNKQVITVTEKAKFTKVLNKIFLIGLVALAIVIVVILVPRLLKKK